ncbi:threonine/serine dehydratase [Nakamurella antarctica]|uniref:threonine ammonia-lyase n=1 Tax=Nakamurella antarctica TaxID=1902245 RepID=A0A3G8ZZT2_9ACTN|nr:threonine/serine dehydratase [Nakamurella antarctica]AZI59051.1 threonine/serine dehydratase [Nakamurella antarctica]
MPELVTLESIQQAATEIQGIAVRTPLLPSPWPDLWLKPETLQPVGAFKIRGAVTAMSRLTPEVRAQGILAHSSGNHAQAVAYAAKVFGIDAHIVVPDNAPVRKIEATRALGATVELVPLTERFSRPAELAASTGKAMIAPFDDANVIAGQGTIGLEIAEDLPDVDVVLVPVSGGGLISGIAAAITALLPNAKVIGVEPELAGDAAASFRSGSRQEWSPHDTARTIADGLRTFAVGHLPWEHIRTQVHDIITVTEDEIAEATQRLLLDARMLAEPSGAVATAAFLFHRSELPPGKTVAIVSGGNIDPAVLKSLVAQI